MCESNDFRFQSVLDKYDWTGCPIIKFDFVSLYQWSVYWLVVTMLSCLMFFSWNSSIFQGVYGQQLSPTSPDHRTVEWLGHHAVDHGDYHSESPNRNSPNSSNRNSAASTGSGGYMVGSPDSFTSIPIYKLCMIAFSIFSNFSYSFTVKERKEN